MYNPSLQQRYCKFRSRCFSGNAPTLSEVSIAFGENIAKVWLQAQIRDLSEYIGIKEKLTQEQIIEFSGLVVQTYYYLKLTEIMVFFSDVKLGKYGEFYGSFDALRLMVMLGKFLEVRIAEIDAMEKQERERKRATEYEESKKNAVTYEEYLKTKELADKGDIKAQEELKPPVPKS